LRAGVVEEVGGLRFNRRMRADRHEQRRANLVVERAKCRRPCARTGGPGFELEGEGSFQRAERPRNEEWII
jgi:hypothetical protein